MRVPATSANLGPGFDSLGLALDLCDEVSAEATSGTAVTVEVQGEGEGTVPLDERHLVAATMLRTFKHLGLSAPGLKVKCRNRIPHARGLGSSSAAIVTWLLLRDPKTLRAMLAEWRPSLPAGFVGALASQGWFLAFALESAARVRTLGLVEMVFSYAVSRKLFRERMTRLEIAGMAFLAAGIAVITLAR